MFMGPTWGLSGADRTQVGPMLAPWTLLSGVLPQDYDVQLAYIDMVLFRICEYAFYVK